MSRLFPAALYFLCCSVAFAAAKAAPKGEEPIQQLDNTGIIAFGVALLVLVVVFLVVMYLNSKKRPQEKDGDKF